MKCLRSAESRDHARMFDIWRSAVEATHDFLSETDAREIALLVKEQYIPNADLWVTIDANDVATAFVGVTDNVVDALFVHNDYRGRGIGGQIIKYMQARFEGLKLDVNEGNPSARAFYEKHGFAMTGRSETDDQGRPYPLIHMEWLR